LKSSATSSVEDIVSEILVFGFWIQTTPAIHSRNRCAWN
jgi:hypothetical protein